MRKQTLTAVFCVAVFFVLGIAGSVEQGAGLGRMALAIPALLVMALVVNKYTRFY